MRPRTLVATNVTGTVAIVSVLFWLGRDHSVVTLGCWAAFLGAGLLVPMHWAGRVEAELARLPRPLPPHLARASLYPVMTGLMTVCAGMALLARLR